MKVRGARFLVFFMVLSLMVSVTTISIWGMKNCDINGAIYDAQSGEPLPGVTVMIQGTKLGTYSDLDGHYKLRNLDPGSYSLIFSLIGYQSSRVEVVQVIEGESKRLDDILLTPEAIEVKGVEVTAKRVTHTEAALLRIQMKAPVISDGISAEQISRSPDSDAAGALRRVTGITVVDGKYVYVRGMGERYSNALLNGATLPSPEPKKRVMPMDLIPANLLENVVTTKTYTADQWGNFSGGSVQLKTKEFPENFTLKFSMSGGWNPQTTGKTLYRNTKVGDTDWLGMDDGDRDIPEMIRKAIEERADISYGYEVYTNDELAQMFNQIWDGRRVKAPLNQSYSLSIGNQSQLLGKPFGYLFSLSYSNKYDYRKEIRREWRYGNCRADYDIEKSTYSVLWGGIFNLNYKFHPYHKLIFNSTYTRDASDEVQWAHGVKLGSTDGLWYIPTVRWTEQYLAHFKLAGEHNLPKIFSSHLDWHASYAEAERDVPDETEITFAEKFSGVYQRWHPALRQWEEIEDRNHSFSFAWTKDFRQWSGLPAKLKLGWAAEGMKRKHMWVAYGFNLKGIDGYQYQEEDLQQREVDRLLQVSNNVTSYGAQRYSAKTWITGTYMMLDIPIFTPLRIITGIRREGTYFRMEYSPAGVYSDVEKDYVDWLPSFNLTYSVTEKMNLRFAASRTVARPDYYELSERWDYEVYGLSNYQGNSELEHTSINNYDLRWETYPSTGELFAVSLFYKRFKNPIELFARWTAVDRIAYPDNTPEAYNRGVEFEIRKNLGFVGRLMSDFSINVNYSIIKSKVKEVDRALMGQSPYVMNLTLGYANDRGTNARLFYNRFGERIAYIGVEHEGATNITEKPFDQLDFVLEQKFWGRLGVKFKVANLLDSEVKFMEGSEPRPVWDRDAEEASQKYDSPVWKYYKKGTSFSVSLSYSI